MTGETMSVKGKRRNMVAIKKSQVSSTSTPAAFTSISNGGICRTERCRFTNDRCRLVKHNASLALCAQPLSTFQKLDSVVCNTVCCICANVQDALTNGPCAQGTLLLGCAASHSIDSVGTIPL
jgi:hypothetical protein